MFTLINLLRLSNVLIVINLICGFAFDSSSALQLD